RAVSAEAGKGQHDEHHARGRQEPVIGGCRDQRSGIGGYWCDKAVAVPGYRLDAAALLAVLVENLTQLSNLDVKVALLDHPSRPHYLHDLVSRDQLSMSLEQETEQGEPAPAQLDRLGPPGLIHSEQTAAAA